MPLIPPCRLDDGIHAVDTPDKHHPDPDYALDGLHSFNCRIARDRLPSNRLHSTLTLQNRPAIPLRLKLSRKAQSTVSIGRCCLFGIRSKRGLVSVSHCRCKAKSVLIARVKLWMGGSWFCIGEANMLVRYI
jgi:hypothetical protein